MRIKILHVCCIGSDFANGMAQIIPEYVNNQSRLADVTLLNFNKVKIKIDNPSLSFSEEKFNINFWHNDTKKKFSEADLIVFHGIYLLKVMLFWQKYVKNKKKYVVVPHGSLTKTAQKKGKLKKFFFNYIFTKDFCEKAQAVQFLSEGEKEASLSLGYFLKSIVIPNGIYLPFQNRRGRYQYRTDNKINIIYIGRYDLFYKGLDLLIEATFTRAQTLRENNVNINLYGPLNTKDYIIIKESIEKKALEDIIQCHDAVYGKEKQNILLSCTFFIQTSRSEGLPMSLLEAMSYGIPVLITEGTNLGVDVKKFGAGLVAKTLVDNIAEMICSTITITNNSYVRMMSGACCLSKEYKWSRIADKMIKEYEKIIEES